MSSLSSLVNLKDFSLKTLGSFFLQTQEIKNNPLAFRVKDPNRTAGLLFFEPSTRTRFSFESACARVGVTPLTLSGIESTSLVKGESFEDTIRNIAAMDPDVMIIRGGDQLDLDGLSKTSDYSIVNAGWGMRGHPTQALLDLYTLWEKEKEDLHGKKLLFVGDVIHSRVVSSHLEVAKALSLQVGFCGPKSFLPNKAAHQIFDSLNDALHWCDHVMFLRVQKERHENQSDLANYSQSYGLTRENIQFLKPTSFVMHPGPINYGVELESWIHENPRSLILQQVTNGVHIRQSLLYSIFQTRGLT